MSYLPLRNWWFAPFAFMARCQKEDYRQQYGIYGVRLFDLRIGFFGDENPMFCHGLLNFKGDVNDVLRWLNDKGDCTVRIILEKGDEEAFKRWVAHWKAAFRDINWCCGVKKKGWKQVCVLKNIEPYIKHYYASMQGNKIDDLWPWLWSKKNNRKMLAGVREDEACYVMIDFVEIR